MELLSDLLMLGLVCAALWTFIPADMRAAASAGIGPLIAALVQTLSQAARAAERALYQLITGRPYPVRSAPKALTPAIEANLTEGEKTPADEQTDRQTDQADAAPVVPAFLRVDRTRKAVVKALVLSGWTVGEVRAVLKGDNNVLSTEIAEAKAELDGTAPRTLVVREAAGERVISL